MSVKIPMLSKWRRNEFQKYLPDTIFKISIISLKSVALQLRRAKTD